MFHRGPSAVMNWGWISGSSLQPLLKRFPAGTDIVTTSGYQAVGVGIADYMFDAALDSAYVAANPRTSFLDATPTARGFRLITDQLLTPEMIGAVGDGTTDDYGAFVAYITLLSNSAGGSARLGHNKTYFIGQHHTATNGVIDLIIDSAVGLTFDGNGATLSFDGSFDRSSSDIAGIGLAFRSCSKNRAFNLTLNGNVQNTTDSSESTESPYSYGLQILGCFDCVFENIESHHFATDGIAVGPSVATSPVIGSKRITLTNCNMHHNARSNQSVFLAEWVIWENCASTYAGVTGGTYPGHSPLCGLDIEPDQSFESGTGDIDTNHIYFEDCKWENNTGSDIDAVLQPNISGPVVFERCRVASAGTAVATINIGVPGVVFRDCYLDVAGQRIELPAGATGLVTHLFDNCDIRGTAANQSTIFSNFTTLKTEFRNCRITCTATNPKSPTANLMAVNNPAFVMEDCRIFVPKAFFVNEGGGACKIFDVIMLRASRNLYVTDMTTAGSYFYTKWNTTPVVSDTYVGAIRGTADTFRPASGSNFDTNFTYSLGDGFAGHPGSGTLTDANVTLQLGSKKVQRLDVAITAARTVTLPAPGNAGRRLRIVRSANATGAFNLNINTSAAVLLKALAAASTWAEVEDDGTEYRLIGAGSL